MTETIRDQILQVRATGRTNMLDYLAVQRIAFEMELYELVTYLEENLSEYSHFILTGRYKSTTIPPK